MKNAEMQNSTAYENLRILCKKVGQRISGSENAEKAIEVTSQMLKTAGADTVFLVPCMIPHWVRGKKESALAFVGKGRRNLAVCALGNSIGTGEKGIKSEVVSVQNFDELRAMPNEDIAGKIVFINYPMKPELLFSGYGDAVQYRGNGPVEAAKKGAIAVIVRSVTHALDHNPHTGATRYEDGIAKIPAFAISTMDANWLYDIAKHRKLQLALKSFCTTLPDVLSYSVVGELKGNGKAEEIVLAGGHLDSWDLAEGAHDDGAGVVQSIEIIRLYKSLGIQPKRTIRVVLFMDEENGGRGAESYAKRAENLGEKHVFAIESDAGGFGVASIGIKMSEEKLAPIRTKWEPLFESFGIFAITTQGGGADVNELIKLGTIAASINPLSQRYFDHHHAPNDVFEFVNKRELELGALAMAGICYLVSEYGLE